jgi:uncharacterized protein YecE (DUF72 family)
MKWHIGCSGFHYKEWKEHFYPAALPQRRWFEYYSFRFDTLELNVTFYRFPQLKSLQNWYTISPSHFYFSVKAPRLITHYKQFRDCEQLLDDFYNTITEGLQEKLGPVLFQLPPAYAYTAERLALLIENMRAGFRNVIEFRHQSWWNTEVYDALKRSGTIFCGISHPGLPIDTIVNNSVAYYRFHGIAKRYYSAYTQKELKAMADSLLTNKRVKEVWVYFNNTATMAAIENAVWLKSYIESNDPGSNEKRKPRKMKNQS